MQAGKRKRAEAHWINAAIVYKLSQHPHNNNKSMFGGKQAPIMALVPSLLLSTIIANSRLGLGHQVFVYSGSMLNNCLSSHFSWIIT